MEREIAQINGFKKELFLALRHEVVMFTVTVLYLILLNYLNHKSTQFEII